jgi:MlaD protein
MRRLAVLALLLVAAVAALAVAGTGRSRGAGGSYMVRAIFDNAGFAVSGETVRIAGANVGSIASVDVDPHTLHTARAPKAAVTLEIDNGDFTPFHANATCTIRPQSLIAERFVDCNPGTSNQPALQKIAAGQPGAGNYYLPVTQTSSPIDFDIVQDISQESIRQRFALIIDEFGTALAARGSDLNAVIRRADPALAQTDQVLKILAHENRVLAQLATDSDTVLSPLAQARHQLSDFVVQANTTGVASAARAADIARSIQLFPSFLRQLRPLMVDLAGLADQGTPLSASLSAAAPALGRQFQELVPFSKAALPATIALGKSAQLSQPYLVATEPLARRLQSLGSSAVPTAASLNTLTASLDKTGAIEQLMALLFNATSATNGFDSSGHYVRVQPLVGDCTGYALAPVAGCSAKFGASAAAASAAPAARIARQAVSAAGPKPRAKAMTGLLRYLTGNGQ